MYTIAGITMIPATMGKCETEFVQSALWTEQVLWESFHKKHDIETSDSLFYCQGADRSARPIPTLS